MATNTFVADAIRKEMNTVMVAFEFLAEGIQVRQWLHQAVHAPHL
jgi:hypothetical protein